MWPLVLLAAAAVSAVLWYRQHRSGGQDRYKLGPLALIFAGAAVMFLVDSAFAYLEEGTFLELTPEALQLSAVLVATGLAMWLVLNAASRLRR